MARDGWGWAGSAGEFIDAEIAVVVAALSSHHAALLRMPPSQEQLRVWDEEVGLLQGALKRASATADISAWSVVLEYELPLEGGRRPDAVVLADGRIICIEFKSGATLQQAHIDQVAAYARDLSEYHSASHGVSIDPVLVLVRSVASPSERGSVLVTGGGGLTDVLEAGGGEGPGLDLEAWLDAPYSPLPTLVAAARRIFEHEALPRIRRAESAHIPESVELLRELTKQAEESQSRFLVLLGGVPGAGKTLAGLSLVYSAGGLEADATFLSGNGPLVKVLQDALQSRVFVRDLHKFITDYGLKEKQPQHHVVVFDEAQRMWDRRYMSEKRGVTSSEPDLLVRAGDRVGSWATLVGLIGEGQEIYVGEEGGIGLWRDALDRSQEPWIVHCPPGVEDLFDGYEVHVHDLLNLEVPMRSRRADDLYEWVRLLLEGSLELAGQKARSVFAAEFPIWLTRDLDAAKAYVRARYEDEPDPRFGLLCSSHVDRKHLKRGLDVSFQTMGRINNRIGRWFNAPPDDAQSCCQLEQPITEFQVQGLEIDLPIVVWGDDYLWNGSGWELAPKRRKAHVDDPQQLLRNVYRVLLTRGRDGLVIVVPNEPQFDTTEAALLAGGARPLVSARTLGTVAAESGGGWGDFQVG